MSLKNAASMTAATLLPHASAFVLILVVARHLLTPGMNQYYAAVALAGLAFTLVADLGTGPVYVRDCSRDPSNISKYFPTLFTIRALSGLACLALSALAAMLAYDPTLFGAVLACAACQLLYGCTQAYASACQAVERMERIAVAVCIQCGLLIPLGAVLTHPALGLGVYGLFAATAIAYAAALLYYATRSGAGTPLGFDLHAARLMLGRGWPMAVAASVYVLWLYNGGLFMSLLCYPGLAFFSLPYNTVTSLGFLSIALGASFYPELARGGEMGRVLGRCMRYIVLLMLPATALLALLPGPFISILAGPGFEGAATPLAAMSLGILPLSVVLAYGSAFNASGLERANMLGTAGGALLCVLCNLLLIPRYGAVGAAAGFVLSASLMAVYLALVALRLRGASLLRMLLDSWEPWAACACMLPVVWYLAPLGIGAGIAGLCIYATVLVGLGWATEEEWSMLHKAAERLRRAHG